MPETTPIEWADATWNPWWGCAEVSPGCSHCYAGTLARRYGFGSTWPVKGEPGADRAHDFRFFADAHWNEPLAWAKRLPEKLGRRPRVFCASMADVFEERAELDAPRDRLFDLILETPELDWLILTKRPEFARDWLADFYLEHGADDPDAGIRAGEVPLPNVWMGTSIENARYTYRADVLRTIPAAIHFLSCEPLLGSLYVSGRDPVEVHPSDPRAGSQSELNGPGGSPTSRPERASLNLDGIDWVIVGGESGGRKARPMHPAWAREIRDACLIEQVNESVRERRPAFFFKQWGSWGPGGGEGALTYDGRRLTTNDIASFTWPEGAEPMRYLGVSPKSGGNELDGREWKEFSVREAVLA